MIGQNKYEVKESELPVYADLSLYVIGLYSLLGLGGVPDSQGTASLSLFWPNQTNQPNGRQSPTEQSSNY